jgi:hypothetical protein
MILPLAPAREHSVKHDATPTKDRLHLQREGESELIDAIRQGIECFGLDLTGRVIVAGATGEFQAITGTAAALAGASRVIVVAPEQKKPPRTTKAFWNAPELAGLAGVSGQLEVVTRIDARGWRDVDILVSCPQIGPITRSVVELLSPQAVVALMAEPWELRRDAVDLDACSDLRVKVTAPNLEHPSIDLLSDLARLCCRLVSDAGIEASAATIALLCDTSCRPHLENALAERGAKVRVFPHPSLLPPDAWDAVVVALRPAEKPSMDINGLAKVFEVAGGTQLVQFSGEIDRLAARYFGLRVWPPRKPARGQLGLPQEWLGRSPMIRRLLGGLKAAEAARRGVALEEECIGYIVEA